MLFFRQSPMVTQWKFFKREAIVARTRSKLQSSLEDIYENYAPIVNDLDEFVEWFRKSEESFADLERAFKQVGLGTRTSAKMKRGEKVLTQVVGGTCFKIW